MSLREPVPGLRTIHNGSNDVAKASVVVPQGGELTVPDEVAEQLMAASCAFKVGPGPAKAEPVEPGDEKPDEKPTAKRGRK